MSALILKGKYKGKGIGEKDIENIFERFRQSQIINNEKRHGERDNLYKARDDGILMNRV